jgi:hypothetical protein
MNKTKGVAHALDHFGNSLNFVVVGIDQRLHVGRIHSHPAGHRRYRAGDPAYSGTKTIAIIGTLLRVRSIGDGKSAGPEVLLNPASLEKIRQTIIVPINQLKEE